MESEDALWKNMETTIILMEEAWMFLSKIRKYKDDTNIQIINILGWFSNAEKRKQSTW